MNDVSRQTRRCLKAVVIGAGLAYMLACNGCVDWPGEPRTFAMAQLPPQLDKQFRAAHAKAVIDGPVYRRDMDAGGNSYAPSTYHFAFRDEAGMEFVADMTPDGKMEVWSSQTIDKLPDDAKAKFLAAFDPLHDIQIAPPIRKLTTTQPPSETGYEFKVSDGRGKTGLAAVWQPERMSLEWILPSEDK